MIVPIDQGDQVVSWLRGELESTTSQEGGLAMSTSPKTIGPSHVLIISRTGIDTLCALKILLGVFQGEQLSYSLVVLEKEQDIEENEGNQEEEEFNIEGMENLGKESRQIRGHIKHFSESTGRDRRWSVLLLDVGARMNLTNISNEDEENEPESNCCSRIFVLDSHRPVHLANLYDTQKVVVLDNGELKGIGERYWKDFEVAYLGATTSDDDSGSESSSQNESDNDDSKEKHEDSPESEEEGLHENGDIDTKQRMNHAKRRSKGKRQTKSQSLAISRTALQYYGRRRYQRGASLCSFSYAIASQLGKVSLSILWTCMVGMAGRLFLEEANTLTKDDQDSDEEDEEDIEEGSLLWQDTLRLLGTELGRFQSASKKSTADEPFGLESGRVKIEEEPNLFMFRHWNIYESILYSWDTHRLLRLTTTAVFTKQSHMAPKPATGIDNHCGTSPSATLDTFLARLGFSLNVAKQPFLYVERTQMKRFTRLLSTTVSEPVVQGQAGLTRGMFVARWKGHPAISCLDVAAIIEAMLCFTKNNVESFLLALETSSSLLSNDSSLGNASRDAIDDVKIFIQRAIELQKARIYLAVKLQKDRALKMLKSQGYHLIVLSADKYPITLSPLATGANGLSSGTYVDFLTLLSGDTEQRCNFGATFKSFYHGRTSQSSNAPLLVAILNPDDKITYHCSLLSSSLKDTPHLLTLALKKAFYLLDNPGMALTLTDEFLHKLPTPKGLCPKDFKLSAVQFPKFIQALKFGALTLASRKIHDSIKVINSLPKDNIILNERPRKSLRPSIIDDDQDLEL